MAVKNWHAFLSLKFMYFFFYAGVAAIFTYLPIFMKVRNVSPIQQGIIYAAMPFFGFAFRPIFGVIADKFKVHRVCLIFSTICTGIVFSCALLVSPFNGDYMTSVDTVCNKNAYPVLIVKDCLIASKSIDFFNQTSFANCGVCVHSVESYVLKNSSLLVECTERLLVRPRSSSQDLDQCMVKFDVFASVREDNHFVNISCKNSEKMMQSAVTCYYRDSQESGWTPQFLFYFVICIGGYAMLSAALSLLDGYVFAVLAEKANFWGRQRCWGTVGYVLAALVAGILLYFLPSHNNTGPNFLIVFLSATVLFIFCAVSALFPRSPNDIHSPEFFRNIFSLFKDPKVLIFIFIVFIHGNLYGVHVSFLIRRLFELGANSLLIGLTQLPVGITEIPFFFVSDYIIKRFGHIRIFQITGITWSLQFLFYSFLHNPWLVIPIEFLRGISFGLMYAAASNYIYSIGPPGSSATMQGLVGGVYFGVGFGVGNLLNGTIYESHGPALAFRIWSIVACCSSIIYVILEFTILRSKPTQNEENVFAHKPEEIVPEQLQSLRQSE